MRQQTSKTSSNVTYGCFVAMGAGVLLPWNATLSALDYYTSIYQGRNIDRLLPACYLPCMLLPLGITSLFHHHMDKHARVVLGFSLFCVAISTPAFCQLVLIKDAPQGSTGTLALTLVSVMVMGAADGIGQGALFAEAAPIPAGLAAMQMGTAISGVVVLLIRVITKAIFHDSPTGLRTSAIVYFMIAEACCALCLAVYTLVLPRLPAVVAARVSVQKSVSAWWDGGGWGGDGDGYDGGGYGGGGYGGGGYGGDGYGGGSNGTRQDYVHVGRSARMHSAWSNDTREEDDTIHGNEDEDDDDMLPLLTQHQPVNNMVNATVQPHAHTIELVAANHQQHLHDAEKDATCTAHGEVAMHPSEGALHSRSPSPCIHAQGPRTAGPSYAPKGGPHEGPSSHGTQTTTATTTATTTTATSMHVGEYEEEEGLCDKLAPINTRRVVWWRVGDVVWLWRQQAGMYRAVWSHMHMLAWAMVLLYATTLSMFPGVQLQVPPPSYLGSWYSVLVVGVFALGDMVGKWLPSLPHMLPHNANMSVYAVVGRAVGFLCVFGLLLVGQAAGWMICATFVFAVTNGYLSTALLLQGTQGLNAAQQEVASSVLIFALAVGLALGSMVAWLWLLL